MEERVVEAFAAAVWSHYREHGRTLPWRMTNDPYAILVSEVMLQQTQVSRVVAHYERFLDAFPDTHALAAAPLADVLAVWSGLGYNRRAVALKRAAEVISAEHGGVVPDTLEALVALPGIGHATAAQILAFAFRVAVPFIETNIRSVYLHHFFCDATDVPDAAILPIVAATLDRDDPREWYYALMDYGTHLKRTLPNPSRRSRHHAVQGRFEGSNRQLRGRLLAALLAGGPAEASELAEAVRFDAKRTLAALEALHSEGFVVSEDGRWRIS